MRQRQHGCQWVGEVRSVHDAQHRLKHILLCLREGDVATICSHILRFKVYHLEKTKMLVICMITCKL